MNREAYKLANEIKTELESSGGCLEACPSDVEMKRYQNNILKEIRREKQTKRKAFYRVSAAACAALVLTAGTISFGDEVHAAIKQISWNISNALGISNDLADYKEVVNTSVADKGYVITLQEVVVSEEKLVMNYTLQREDGQPMENWLTPDGVLYLNGKNVTDAAGGSSNFLDEEHKILGVTADYEIHNTDCDLSQENDYQIVFHQLGFTDGVKGTWSFSFRADGAELMADTRRTEISRTFQLPDGIEVTLKELTQNDLEQRITYDLSGATDYILMIKAEDETGVQAEFGVRSQTSEYGYMQNEEIIDDGRISEKAQTVTMTLHAVKLPEEDGRISDDYQQIGESFQLKLN